MKRFLLFVLVATMFAACITDVAQDVSVEVETPETLTVSLEDNSRIQLQNGKTIWTAGDLVSVFYLSNANQKWQYQGETGERIAQLKRVANADATQELSSVVVVYPYNENYYINPRTCNVRATLPDTQHYLNDSYGLDGNILISLSEYNQFSLKNVCGWLKVQLTGNGENVKYITLKGNDGEQVAGQIYINSADATATLASEMGAADDNENGTGGNLVFDDTIIKEVTLDCGDGVTLGAEATAFYIALPPQTFEKGVTIDIEAADGSKMTKSTDNTIVIKRNTIQPMAAFEGNFELKISNNEIWYTATTKIEPTEADEIDASLISNKWDSVTKRGVLTFNNEITSIGNWAFAECEGLETIYIPDSVTWIGNHCFGECYNLHAFYGKYASADNRCLIINGMLVAFAQAGLTEYTIPSGVTTITNGAFYLCESLRNITIPEGVISTGYTAFHGSGIEKVVLPESLTSIGYSTFGYCMNLKEVVIPSNVTTVAEGAFYGCNSLKKVYCKPTTPPTLGDANFYYENHGSGAPLTDYVIYVPKSALNAYKNDMWWNEHVNHIVGYDF